MNPVLVHLGPFQVNWYGLLIVSGALLAAWLSTKEAIRRGEDPEHIWNVLTWALLLGIIGARLYHVFSSPSGNFAGWSYYRDNPIAIIRFWDGGLRGLGIFGAVAGGSLAMVLYVWRNHLSLARWMDIPMPGLLLAQAIGRMGNRINQELYGPPTNLPWAYHINPAYPCQPPANLPPNVAACGDPAALDAVSQQWYAANGFHPTFYYEAIWNVLGFALLWILGRRLRDWLRDGDIFFMYLIWYPAGRFWVEMFRPDAWMLGALPTAQWISLTLVTAGFTGLFINHHRPRRSEPAQMRVEQADGDATIAATEGGRPA